MVKDARFIELRKRLTARQMKICLICRIALAKAAKRHREEENTLRAQRGQRRREQRPQSESESIARTPRQRRAKLRALQLLTARANVINAPVPEAMIVEENEATADEAVGDLAGVDVGADAANAEELLGRLVKTSSGESDTFIDVNNFISELNKILPTIGVTLIKMKDIRTPSYCREKLEQITEALERKIFNLLQHTMDEPSVENADQEILQQLKEKFGQNTDFASKYKILTTVPRSWTAYRVRQEFDCSKHLSEAAVKLAREYGIMSSPIQRIGTHVTDPAIVAKVIEFYTREEISNVCPGKRDYVTVDENNERKQIQRRLLLMNINEAYALFKEENPNAKIGFSKFASLRPPEVILALSTGGTHSTCVCQKHQNVKLVFEQMKKMFIDLNLYRDFFQKMLCVEPNDRCFLRECDRCSGVRAIEEYLGQSLRNNGIVEFSIKQWVSEQSKYRLH